MEAIQQNNEEEIDIHQLAERTMQEMDALLDELEQLVDFDYPKNYIGPFDWVREQLLKIQFDAEVINFSNLFEHFNIHILYIYGYLRKKGYTIIGRPRYSEEVASCARKLGDLKRDIEMLSDYQFEERKKLNEEQFDKEAALEENEELKLQVSKFRNTLLLVIGMTAVSIFGGVYYVASKTSELKKEITNLKLDLKIEKQRSATFREVIKMCGSSKKLNSDAPRIESRD